MKRNLEAEVSQIVLRGSPKKVSDLAEEVGVSVVTVRKVLSILETKGVLRRFHGEARAFNSAVIFAHPTATVEQISTAVELANRQLPDYARVGAWISANTPFTSNNGMATANGRLRRTNILEAYGDQINALYQH